MFLDKVNEINNILNKMNYKVIPDLIQDENQIPASSNNFAYSIMPQKSNKYILTSNCSVETFSFEIKIYYLAKTEDEKLTAFRNFLEVIKALQNLEKKIENAFELINSKSYQFRGKLNFNY